MISRLKKKIAHLRTQPEGVKIQTATTVAFIGAIIIGLIWLFILLPLQLWLQAPQKDNPPSPTASAAPSVSPSPALIQGSSEQLLLPQTATSPTPNLFE